MAGSIEGADNHFRDGSGIEAHFGVAMDGRVWQWRDTTRQADAQAGGNDYCISIETEDKGDPTRPWTPVQLVQLDLLCRWLGRVHSIPMRLVSSTAERGLGYHRQFDVWNPNLHSCPGDVRLGQLVHTLIPGLQAPLDSGGLTMDEAQVIVRQIATGDETVGADRAVNNLKNIREEVEALTALVKEILALLNAPPQP
jgi:hypothetical protein